jgi:hypothetical protein
MRRPNIDCPSQVGDGTGELEHAVIRPRREVQLAHGRLHEALPGLVQTTKLAHFSWPHTGVGAQVGALGALRLNCSCSGDTLADGRRRLALARASCVSVSQVWS